MAFLAMSVDQISLRVSQPSYAFDFGDELSVLPLPYVSLNFKVQGKDLNFDHSYALYSALSHFQARIHTLGNISIQPIQGIPQAKRLLALTDASCLKIRLPVELVPLFYPLAGKQFVVGEHRIRLGIPQMHFLRPAPNLYSPIVTVRGYKEPEIFLEAAQRQLQQLGIQGRLSLSTNTHDIPTPRIRRVKQYSIVGFGVEVSDLNNQDSLLLQTLGIGGKQKMGCGVFLKR